MSEHLLAAAFGGLFGITLAVAVHLSKVLAALLGRGQFWIEITVRLVVLGGFGVGAGSLLLPSFERLVRENSGLFFGTLLVLLVATSAAIGAMRRREPNES